MITPQHLRMARAGLGWTLTDLAKHAEVNPNTLSRYETGHDILSGTLRKVEQALRDAGIIFIDDETGLGVLLPKSKPTPHGRRRSEPRHTAEKLFGP